MVVHVSTSMMEDVWQVRIFWPLNSIVKKHFKCLQMSVFVVLNTSIVLQIRLRPYCYRNTEKKAFQNKFNLVSCHKQPLLKYILSYQRLKIVDASSVVAQSYVHTKLCVKGPFLFKYNICQFCISLTSKWLHKRHSSRLSYFYQNFQFLMWHKSDLCY